MPSEVMHVKIRIRSREGKCRTILFRPKKTVQMYASSCFDMAFVYRPIRLVK